MGCNNVSVIARYLLNNGAHPALVNSDGDTPFDIAEDEEVQDLLQSTIDSQGNYYPGSCSLYCDLV